MDFGGNLTLLAQPTPRPSQEDGGTSYTASMMKTIIPAKALSLLLVVILLLLLLVGTTVVAVIRDTSINENV